MSEEKYEEKVLKLLASIAEQTKPQPPPKPAESSEHVHTPKDVFDCPECGDTYLKAAEQKLRPKIEKETKEKFKRKDLLTCDGCGEIVEKEAAECPTCKGTSAH